MGKYNQYYGESLQCVNVFYSFCHFMLFLFWELNGLLVKGLYKIPNIFQIYNL